MNSSRPALFRKRQFEPVVIVTCVSWYLRFSLSLRDVEELMDGFEKAKKDFVGLATKVGEEADKVQPEEFFGVLAEFAKQFDAAKAEVMKGRELMLKVDDKREKLHSEIKTPENATKLKKANPPKSAKEKE